MVDAYLFTRLTGFDPDMPRVDIVNIPVTFNESHLFYISTLISHDLKQ